MTKINIFNKLFFEIKLLWLDYCFYTFNTLHEGCLYPPSFYLRYTEEERQEICRKELEELKEMLRKYDEENHVTHHDGKPRK